MFHGWHYLELCEDKIFFNFANSSFTFTKEWPKEKYPPWAHGPGYVVSHDIAKGVHKKYKRGHLKVLHILSGLSNQDMQHALAFFFFPKQKRFGE